MIRKMHFRLCVAMGDISNILGGALGYSWDIRGMFGEYSWDIRMYRVCVGNVSGMYREYIERYGEGKMRKTMSIIPNVVRVSVSMWSCVNHPRLF